MSAHSVQPGLNFALSSEIKPLTILYAIMLKKLISSYMYEQFNELWVILHRPYTLHLCLMALASMIPMSSCSVMNS